MKPTPGQPRRHHDRPSDTGPAVEDHGRVITTSRRAAAFYRQAQRAVDGPRASAALRHAVNADPAFGLAVADLDAITKTAGKAPSRRQMSWERHHIEVVRTAATGNAQRAADLLREHLASVGCDPIASVLPPSCYAPAGKTTSSRTSSADSPAVTQPRGLDPRDRASRHSHSIKGVAQTTEFVRT